MARDWHANIRNSMDENRIGIYALGNRNKAGEQHIYFYQSNDFSPSPITFFKQNDTYILYTDITNGIHTSQIDDIISVTKRKSSLVANSKDMARC